MITVKLFIIILILLFMVVCLICYLCYLIGFKKGFNKATLIDDQIFEELKNKYNIGENKKMTRANRIRSMTDEEMAKDRVLWENDTVDGEEIPGRYVFVTSYGERCSTRKEAEEKELKYLRTEI